MDKKSKEEIHKLFSDSFHEVVPPLLGDMEERLASKEDVNDLIMEVDSLDRKFDAQQDRMDRHGKQLDNHEKRIHALEFAPI